MRERERERGGGVASKARQLDYLFKFWSFTTIEVCPIV